MDKFHATTPYQDQLLQNLARNTSRLKNESAAILLQCCVRAFVSRRRARLAFKKKEVIDAQSLGIVQRLVDEAVLLGVISVVNEMLPTHNKSVDYKQKFNIALVSVTEELYDTHVDALSVEVLKETITETINVYIEHRQTQAKKNPLVRVVLELLEGVLVEEIMGVVRLAINDIINDYLAVAHCQRGLDKIFTELMGDIGHPLALEAWMEMDESTSIDIILNEVLSELISEVSKTGFQEMINENSELYERAQMNHVGVGAGNVIGKQIVMSHLMYLMGKNFDSIIVQRMTKGIVNVNVISRLLSILNFSEFEIKSVTSNECSKKLLKSSIEPALKEVLLEKLKVISSEIVDQIDIMEGGSH
jgi:hypothetical protein